MITGLVHRCTIWQPQGAATDAYGQPALTAFAQTATDVRCRFDGKEQDAPQLLVTATAPIALNDRITNVQDRRGATIDAGPFAVQEIVAPTGRAEVAYRRLTLRRLISIDQT